MFMLFIAFAVVIAACVFGTWIACKFFDIDGVDPAELSVMLDEELSDENKAAMLAEMRKDREK